MLVMENNGPGAASRSSSPTPPGRVTGLPLASPLGRMKQCRLHRGAPGTLRAASRKGDALAKLCDYSHLAGVQTGLYSKRTTGGPRSDSGLPSSGPRLLTRATKHFRARPCAASRIPSHPQPLGPQGRWPSMESTLPSPLLCQLLSLPVASLHPLPPLPPCLHPSPPPHTFIPELPRESQEEIRKGAWGTDSAPWLMPWNYSHAEAPSRRSPRASPSPVSWPVLAATHSPAKPLATGPAASLS